MPNCKKKTSNGFAGRDALLKKPKRRYADATLPDGDKVRIQSLNEREKAGFEAFVVNNKQKMSELRARLLILCIVDGDGKRLFGDEDFGAICEMDGGITAAIFDVAQEHCGFAPGDIEESVKKLRRNPRRLFAYRLARIAGRLDVDEMLDELTPEQVDEWWAAFRLEPWDVERELVADLKATLFNIVKLVFCAISGDELTESEIFTPEHFLEGHKVKQPGKRRLTAREQEIVLKARFGRKRSQ